MRRGKRTSVFCWSVFSCAPVIAPTKMTAPKAAAQTPRVIFCCRVRPAPTDDMPGTVLGWVEQV